MRETPSQAGLGLARWKMLKYRHSQATSFTTMGKQRLFSFCILRIIMQSMDSGGAAPAGTRVANTCVERAPDGQTAYQFMDC